MGIDLEECLKTANMQAFYSDPYSLRASTQIKALCQEVESLRKELTEYHKQDNQTHRLIAKIEILEAKNETLRELVGEDAIETINAAIRALEVLHPKMDEDEPCIVYEVWMRLKELRTKIAELGKEIG